jgi:RNA polymerase sigma factor (sigma-70 family)
MSDEDAFDRQLYESGDIATLLARYDGMIRGTCIARLHGHPDADDVAQSVRMRLLTESRRGKRYAVPYRVVVWQVTKWTIDGYFTDRRLEDPLPDDWDEQLGGHENDVVTSYHLDGLLGALPTREREVAERRYVHALEPDQIAEELGITRNNVDQALSRARSKLREQWDE